MGQTSFDAYEMTVHKGHKSLLVTLPYLLCRRNKIKAGDKVIFDRPEGEKKYTFSKAKRSRIRYRL